VLVSLLSLETTNHSGLEFLMPPPQTFQRNGSALDAFRITAISHRKLVFCLQHRSERLIEKSQLLADALCSHVEKDFRWVRTHIRILHPEAHIPGVISVLLNVAFHQGARFFLSEIS
jgi:hypothetical protein